MLVIKCGVRQDSIVEQLLFIIYINDIIYSFKIAKLIMFTDDTNLFLKHKNLETLYNIINCKLAKISDWFKLSKLSLNIKN